MPAVENKISRKHRNNDKDNSELEKQLSRLGEDIRRLKIEFDIYFNGSSKRPPLEFRSRVEANIKRIADNRNLSYSQRYLYTSLVSTFTSYRELWRRSLRARGEDLI